MSLQIKIILAVALLALGGLAAWYVQGLRAENARLTTELAQAVALSEDNRKYIEQLQSISTIQQEIQEATQQKITSLNSQIAKIRKEGATNNVNKKDIETMVTVAVADKLNSLRQRTGSNN